MMSFAIVTKWGYLKVPKYSWTFHNASGGSFSNSGMQPSFNRCVEHLRSVYGGGIKIRTFEITLDAHGRDVRIFHKDKSNF